MARAAEEPAVEAVHPRDVFGLKGAEDAERAWLEALDRGRMHHAWLLVGPEGVGKSIFAYRAARRLLGARPDPEHGLIGADPDDPVSRQVSARAHPDLLVLQRLDEDGKARRNIPVDEARKLPEFFAMSPAISPWRVAIIDAADDLNVNAANAVLKTLEEPPPRGVLLLVCHAPGKLLPTIRSRCRRLMFRPWPDADVAEFVGESASLDFEAAARIAAMAKGSPGRALELARAGALEVDQAAREILRQLPQIEDGALLALAHELRGQEGNDRLQLLFERLAEHVKAMVEAGAGREGGPSPAWFDVWDQLTNLPAEAEGLNLDRQDVFWSAVAAMREAARA
jgi:DNA polymerase-3 subunit delta'